MMERWRRLSRGGEIFSAYYPLPSPPPEYRGREKYCLTNARFGTRIGSVMHRMIFLIVVALGSAIALGGTVDPPMRVHAVKLDKTELNGWITAYADDDFDFMDAKKQTSKVQWNELSPDVAFNLNSQLMTPRK